MKDLIVIENGKIAPKTLDFNNKIESQMKELKELLDLGIITQEEFDAKKKQLLGL